MVEVAKNWLEILTDGSAAVKAIYGDLVPKLNNLEFHELIVHQDGPRVSLRFDLAEFPSQPPKKWLIAGANKVQISLMLVSVCDLKICGIKTDAKIDLNIERRGGCINAWGGCDGFDFSLQAEFLMLNSISAYRDDIMRDRLDVVRHSQSVSAEEAESATWEVGDGASITFKIKPISFGKNFESNRQSRLVCSM